MPRACATTLESEMTKEELDLLLSLLASSQFQGKHLEIGTAAGGTLWKMLRVFGEERPPFIVVDPMAYFENQFEIVCENLREHLVDPEAVDFRRQSSYIAFLEASGRGERFDFIFVDGNHKLPYVTKDLLWTRLLNVGGLICFHDYLPPYPGVVRAVDGFLRKYPNYQKVAQAGSLVAVKKESVSSYPEVTSVMQWKSHVEGLLLQLNRSLKKRLWKNK